MEHKSEPILSQQDFVKRMIKYFLVSFGFISISLVIGMVGYRHYCDLNWTESFYNASMILTGMGPALGTPNDPCMIFSGVYALYSGIAFLTSAGIMVTPLLHRLLHTIHLDPND